MDAASTDNRLRVGHEGLRCRVDPAALPFESSAEVAPLESTIGQPRALEAIDFGLEVASPGLQPLPHRASRLRADEHHSGRAPPYRRGAAPTPRPGLHPRRRPAGPPPRDPPAGGRRGGALSSTSTSSSRTLDGRSAGRSRQRDTRSAAGSRLASWSSGEERSRASCRSSRESGGSACSRRRPASSSSRSAKAGPFPPRSCSSFLPSDARSWNGWAGRSTTRP